MTETEFKKNELKDNVVSVRVDESTFRRIMAIAHKYADGSMSTVARLCIDAALDNVEEYLKASHALKVASLKLPKVPKV